MVFRAEHFKEEEFLCPCCGGGTVVEGLVMWLEVLRRAWGAPIIVNSGWRCRARNAHVGGAPASRHLIGCAADVRAKTSGESEWLAFSLLAKRLTSNPGWEFRPYNTFIHIAVPRKEAAKPWRGGGIEM
jgi:uncharacterized protein YcbK (DUF882 family)